MYALEALVAAASVELEDKGYQTEPWFDAAALRRHLAEFDRLVERYAAELPRDAVAPTRILEQPEELAAGAVTRVRDWCMGLLLLQRRIRAQERERANLTLLAEFLDAMRGASSEIGAMGRATPFLYKNIFACPKAPPAAPEADDEVLSEVYAGKRHDFWIVAGAAEHTDVLEGTAALLHCIALKLPDWLPADARAQREVVGARLHDLDHAIGRDKGALANHRADTRVREAIANARILRWYQEVAVHRPTPDRKACQLTGWTTADDPAALQRALEHAGIKATVVFAEPRADLRPPVSLSEKRWARPFQWFVKLLGTPGENEVDPTPLLAFLVPLLFGFMFPDIGHGLILALAGYLISRRVPDAVILVPCGLAATGFGLLFGELFGFHNVIPSPCGCPLDNPVGILLATLIIGVVLILLGLVFSGVEAYWRGEIKDWLLEGAPLLALYLSGVLALIAPGFLLATAAAVVWYLGGIAWLCRKAGGRCLAGRLGHFFEGTLQLIINTLSFMRVGAFALGHAAFSVVVLEITRSVDDTFARVLIFAIGHVVIMVLEGLIVMVQTTRLILFEFFIRFLRFEGRIYRPLTHPGYPVKGA